MEDGAVTPLILTTRNEEVPLGLDEICSDLLYGELRRAIEGGGGFS